MQNQKPSTLTSTMTSKLSNKLISSLSLSTCALGLVVLSPAVSAHAELSTAFESVSMNTQDGTTLKMVKAADTPLRCGDQDVFYTIAELGADTPLQTIGKSGAYTQVVLPRSIGAFVPASEAEVSANKKTVTLTTSSSLRAPSHLLGLSGSWKAIYTTALPSGTTLNVIEVIQSDAGTVLGYRVVAPTSPSGELPVAFIKTDALRDPTTSEIDGDESLVRALDQRLEWIKIRIESRDQRRAIAATLAAYDQRADQLANDIEAWQSGRAYQLVGRMVTSSVYTGEHLPLLYRVQSIDPTSGVSRTVGYVAPRDDQDFRHLLGRVVGVIGSMNADDSLKLSVIEPDRIDPMPE